MHRVERSMVAPEFVLKTTPPRLPRSALDRPPLQRIGEDARERTAITLVAPSGFGKTTLLAQWRRRRMEQGALVAWYRVDPQDDPARFTTGLLHAMHAASGRAAFEALRSQFATDPARDIDALTELLAEIAYLGKSTVLMIDDAERLPEETVHRSLRYLLHNAPPNLHIVIGSRTALALDAWELLAKGDLVVVGADELRLSLEESTALLRRRFGTRLSIDQCARVHEATCGWTLGLQLVAAAIEREPDLDAAIDSISARSGDIERYFVETLAARLSADTLDFLVRTSILDHLNPESCEAVTGRPDARELIARLREDTPILSVAGSGDWVRVHPLARDFLLGHFERLPPFEKQALHARASHWFAAHHRFHEAACHALEAGDETLAQAYAARALWSLTGRGKLLEAREWLVRLPAHMVDADPDLAAVAAWIRAIGEDDGSTRETALAILHAPDTTPHRRFVAARAAGNTGFYGDRIGLLHDIVESWRGYRPDPMAPIDDPVEALAYANGSAMVALQEGDPHRAREFLADVGRNVDKATAAIPLANRILILGLSHLWEGDPRRAEALMVPALAAAERTDGRRGLAACSFATVLAAALIETGRPDEAEALLAHRLDVIERFCLPDIILLAYRTLASVALVADDEHRALLVLDALCAFATRRRLPRLAMYGLAERIRLHALHDRRETVDDLLRALDALGPWFDDKALKPLRAQHALVASIAHAHAAIARRDFTEATTRLAAADILAAKLNRHRDAWTVKVLRAVVARMRGAPEALELLAEARGLAAIGGCERLLVDTHPLAVRMAAELDSAKHDGRPGSPDGTHARHAKPTRRAARGGLLTTKETEILALLAKGMSNKAIARAMEISHETVKWHVKNLSLKLAAGTRKHAVDRARLLGLLAH